MAASELPEDQFTQDFRTQRRNYGDGDTRIGDHDRLWYDGRTRTIRIYDGTEGGTILAGADYIGDNIDLDDFLTSEDLAAYATTAYVDSLVGDSTQHVTDAELVAALTPYATIQYVNDLLEDSSAPVTVADLDAAVDGLASEAYVDSLLATDLTPYSTTVEMNTAIGTATTDMATQTWVGAQGYLTAHQDITGKADVGVSYTKAEADAKFLTAHQSLADYSTTVEMNTAISTAVNDLVGGADSTLDTLNELAAALGDDANFAATVTNSLAGKSDLDHTHDFLKGDVFADDSSLLVDAENSKIVGDIETSSLKTSEQSIHLGQNSGATTPGNYSLAIGLDSGQTNQGIGAIAIGKSAGDSEQGDYAIAIGYEAGQITQGNNAIAIGKGAGEGTSGDSTENNQAANSIVINATGNVVNNSTANSLVIKPIRGATGSSFLYYDNSTGEVTHDTTSSFYTKLEVDALIPTVPTNVSDFTNDAGYITTSQSIDQLSDVDTATTAPTSGQALVWNGSEWVPGTVSSSVNSITQGDSAVTVTDTGSDGNIEFKTENTARWDITSAGHIIPAANSTYDIGSAERKVRHFYLSNNSLKFVDEGEIEYSLGVAGGQLFFNGEQVSGAASGATSMAGLSDVDSDATVASGDFLLYDGSEYGFVNFASEVNTYVNAGITSASIQDLSDVDGVDTLANGDMLLFDGTDFGFVNFDSTVLSYFTGYATESFVNDQVRKDYTVTVSSGDFYIDGVQQPILQLQPGNIYRFDQSDVSNATHPLRFSTLEDGTHSDGGVEYTTGVTTNGTPGNTDAYVEITVTNATPRLYYYCENHSGMGSKAGVGQNAYVNSITSESWITGMIAAHTINLGGSITAEVGASIDFSAIGTNVNFSGATVVGLENSDVGLGNIQDDARGVVVRVDDSSAGNIAVGSIEVDTGGSISASTASLDFTYSTVYFQNATVYGLGDTIRDEVDFHLNQDSTIEDGQLLSWNATGGFHGTGDYEWIDITSSDLDMGGNKVLFGNMYSTLGDLPNATTYHGMFAHVHDTGKAYYAHADNWIELANASDVSSGMTSLIDDPAPQLGGNLVTGDNRITYNDGGVVSFLDFTATQFGQIDNTVLSSVKSINLFLDSNLGDSNQAFRIYNDTNPDVEFPEETYIFKVADTGDVDVRGNITVAGTATLSEAMQLTPRSSAPSSPTGGMMAVDDGTDWSGVSGSVESLVVYINGSWSKLA